MYYLCDQYEPDPGLEIRLIQELAQEYPAAGLFQQFRKAKNWLEDHPKKRPKDLRRFLRNWVSNAVNKYGEGRRDVDYEEEVVFVPVPVVEREGGAADATGT